MTRRIPITLISGYLGAGKTTIINHLLASDHDRRIAVLVNDFGAINIDADLISDRDERAISLANGCVCCSITDDLGMALDTQAVRETPPELVVLEASGVSNPLRIARHAGNWPGFELDAIVTVVDVETILERAKDKFVGRLVKDQIQSADLVVLTKGDLVTIDRVAAVKDWIDDLAPGVRLLNAPRGHLDHKLLFGRTTKDFHETDREFFDHQTNIRTYHWIPPKPFSVKVIDECLNLLPQSVHRAKGFFVDVKTGKLTLVQKVGRRQTFEPALIDASPGLVLISAGSAQDLEIAQSMLDAISTSLP